MCPSKSGHCRWRYYLQVLFVAASIRSSAALLPVPTTTTTTLAPTIGQQTTTVTESPAFTSRQVTKQAQANNNITRAKLSLSTPGTETVYYETSSYFQPLPAPPSPALAIAAPQPSQLEADKSPRSDRTQVLETFKKFFIKARSHDDAEQKEFVRDGVVLRMRELGFETSFLQKSRFEFRRKSGSVPAYSYNMISILPGKYRQTRQDRIVLVGAHWDTATKAPGVDDNGSGSACLLEIARLISENRCKFEHTVMLVWFDYEEQGKYGSEFFVNDYLFPREIHKYGSKFIGAYIMDMILVRDKEVNSQTLPVNLTAKLDYFADELARDRNRGDFLAAWSRKQYDEPLEGIFRQSWTDLGYESRTFKAMRPELPQMRMPNSEERFEWKDFFRSDHASFWFPPITSPAVRRSPNRTSTHNHTSLNAILLTDLGPWRRSYSKCYHSACDDDHLLTDGNLSFMQQVIDSLVLTLLRVGHGECSTPLPDFTTANITSPVNDTSVKPSSESTMTLVTSNTTTTSSPVTVAAEPSPHQ